MREVEQSGLVDGLRTAMVESAVDGLNLEPYDGKNKLFNFVAASDLDPDDKLNSAYRHSRLMLDQGSRFTYKRTVAGVNFRFLNSEAFVGKNESGLDYDSWLRLGETTADDWCVLVFDRTKSNKEVRSDNPLAIQFNGSGVLKLGGGIVNPNDPGLGEEIDFIFQKVKEIGANLNPRQRALARWLTVIYGEVAGFGRNKNVRMTGKIGLTGALTLGALYGPQTLSGDRDTLWPQPMEGLIDWNNRPDHIAQGIPASEGGVEVQIGNGPVAIPYVEGGNFERAPNAVYEIFEGPEINEVRPGTYRVDLGRVLERTNLSPDTTELREDEIIKNDCVPVRGAYNSGQTVAVSQNPDHADGHLTIEAVSDTLAQICDVNGQPLGPQDGSVILSQRFRN